MCADSGPAQYNDGNGQVWLALITFLYVDLFDTTGYVGLAVFGHDPFSDYTAHTPPVHFMPWYDQL